LGAFAKALYQVRSQNSTSNAGGLEVGKTAVDCEAIFLQNIPVFDHQQLKRTIDPLSLIGKIVCSLNLKPT